MSLIINPFEECLPAPVLGVWSGGGGALSPLVGLLAPFASTGTVGIWDAGFGLSPDISGTTAEWASQIPGGHDWTQLANAAAQATPVMTAGGKAAQRFAGGQWYKCDALAALITGTDKPYWFAAAVEGVPRDATGRTLLSIGNNAATKLRSIRPNHTAALSRHYNLNDAGSHSNVPTTTGRASGIIIARDNGSTMNLRWGTTTNSAASGGNLDCVYGTLGADRYGAVPTIAAFLSGDLLGCAFGIGILDNTAELALYNVLKTWAGY